jgi:hypothetical protein
MQMRVAFRLSTSPGLVIGEMMLNFSGLTFAGFVPYGGSWIYLGSRKCCRRAVMGATEEVKGQYHHLQRERKGEGGQEGKNALNNGERMRAC